MDFRSERLCTGLEDEVRFNKAYGGICTGGCWERGCVLIVGMKSPGLSPYKANRKPKQSWLWGNFTGNDTENGPLMLGGQVRHMTHNLAGWVEKLGVSARTVRKGSLRASLLGLATARNCYVSTSYCQSQTPEANSRGNNRACSWAPRMAQGQDHYSSGVHGHSSCV